MVRCRHDLYKYHGELLCLTKPIWRKGEGTRNNVKDGNKYCFSSCPFSRWRCGGSLEGFPRLLFLTLLWAIQIFASDFIYAEKSQNKKHCLEYNVSNMFKEHCQWVNDLCRLFCGPGWGTDEQAVIAILARRDATQRKQITLTYEQMYNESLLQRLQSELSGDFEVAQITFAFSWLAFVQISLHIFPDEPFVSSSDH
jgi:hypothetical protein